jgi:hypothetical protein
LWISLDLIGRRYVALIGRFYLFVAGMVLCSTAHAMNTFIGRLRASTILKIPPTFETDGMVLAGIGAGIKELTSLPATWELAPTSKHGNTSLFLFSQLFPSANRLFRLSSSYPMPDGGRVALYVEFTSIGFFLTLFFYFPRSLLNSLSLSRKDIISQIDSMGGFLSITGAILFMAGMQWGSYMVSWLRYLKESAY